MENNLNLPNSLKKIEAALMLTGTMRGSKLDRSTLTAYSKRLNREPEQDVLLALEKLAELPRKEYESAIPDLGSLLDLVKVCTVSRINRSNAERAKRLVRWKCPECGVSCAGWVEPLGNLERRCHGLPKSGRRGIGSEDKPICGAKLEVTYDEMDYPRSEEPVKAKAF